MHERTFRNALRKAGLNQYLFEMANIREQCSWVHEDSLAATEKAKALVRGAVLRVARHEPLDSVRVDMCPETLVLGGGISGMIAALELADAGYKVCLVERQDRLGGNLARVDSMAPYLDSARDLLTDRITRVREHERIRILLRSQLTSLEGFVGNFQAIIQSASGNGAKPSEIRLKVGSVVVCTGYKEFDAGPHHALRLRKVAECDYLV